MLKTLLLILLSALLTTSGQIFFKKSANALNSHKDDKTPWVSFALKTLFLYPSIWIGTALMVIGLLFWFAAISTSQLSFVYQIGSIQYISMLIGCHYFLKEKITFTKLLGTGLITVGIILTLIS